jgi:hypothetical protein
MLKVKPYYLYFLNSIICGSLFMLVVWPNFYTGLTKFQYGVFYGSLIFIATLQIVFGLRHNVNKLRFLYPVIILIIFWGALYFSNFI